MQVPASRIARLHGNLRLDLMSLLMCFFVLLLSFAEMDVQSSNRSPVPWRRFGVQNILEVKDIPKGTSVIAQEFRPGRPEPTPIDTIMQQTIDMTQTELDFQPGDADKAGGHDKTEGQQSGGDTAQEAQKAQEQSNTLAKALAEQMQAQIQDGAIEIEALGQQIIIRIREKAAFPAGSAFLQPQFWPVIRKVAALLKDVPGRSPSPATPTMWPPRMSCSSPTGSFRPSGRWRLPTR